MARRSSGSGGGSEEPSEMLKLETASDAALVVAIARMHEPALAEAYRRHGGAVLALARRVLGSADLAEEVTQEVFVDLWDSPERFDPGRGALRTFLMTKAHGRAVDIVRSESARRQREERTVRETAVSGYDIEHQAWDLAIAEQVKAAVTSLPAEERTAIEMAYFDGHTYREVASILGQPEGTVKSRIRSGLRRLRVRPGAARCGDSMDRAVSHDEIAQLLGAFALDAVDPDEAEAIRAHLTECPRCAAEVAEHWEATGLIANAGVDAPAELWDRIAAQIDTEARTRRPAPCPLGVIVPVASPARRRCADGWRGRRWARVAAAAAVVAVLLGVQVDRLDQRVAQVASGQPTQSGLNQAVQAALLDPSAQKVTLVATSAGSTGTGTTLVKGARAAVVVVLPDGSAFMRQHRASPLGGGSYLSAVGGR